MILKQSVVPQETYIESMGDNIRLYATTGRAGGSKCNSLKCCYIYMNSLLGTGTWTERVKCIQITLL